LVLGRGRPFAFAAGFLTFSRTIFLLDFFAGLLALAALAVALDFAFATLLRVAIVSSPCSGAPIVAAPDARCCFLFPFISSGLRFAD
jgi:hypothetical protein